MIIMSWNIKQFNYAIHKSMSDQFARIEHIVETVKSRNVDILVVMEVRPSVKSPIFGERYEDSQGAAAIYELCVRLGETWACSMTGGNAYKESNKGELYAFLWRTDRVADVNQASLVNFNAQNQILPFKNRVPGMMLFSPRLSPKKIFSVICYHAPNPSEMHKDEIIYLKQIKGLLDYPTVICGDFNMDTRTVHTVLQPEFDLAITNDSSLRVNLTGEDSPYDAIFYREIKLLSASVDNQLTTAVNMFGMPLTSKEEIKSIKSNTSDHAPVWAQFDLIEKMECE